MTGMRIVMNNKFVQIAAMFITMSLNASAHEVNNTQYAYITDNVYKPVRSEPVALLDNILIHLASNIKVEVIENIGQWTKILYANNKVGFIPSRHLVSGSTSKLRLERLQAAYAQLHKENENLQQIITSTKAILILQNKLLFDGDLDNDKN
jgi:uncharacterized protein YgiM (DUF1202 family)